MESIQDQIEAFYQKTLKPPDVIEFTFIYKFSSAKIPDVVVKRILFPCKAPDNVKTQPETSFVP